MDYRKATIKDINMLIELRKNQLIDEGVSADKDINDELEDFFQRKLAEGSLIQWLVMEKNEIIATGAIVIYEFPPTYTNKSGKSICNQYVYKECSSRKRNSYHSTNKISGGS